jgi:PAS domain S-box-containing protein
MVGSFDINRWRGSSPFPRYGLAGLVVPGATLIQHLGDNHFAVTPSYFCAVLLTAWFGGLGPGLFAIALSILALMYYFVPPTGTFVIDAAYTPSLILFLLAALFATWLSVRERNAAKSLVYARDQLDLKICELKKSNQALRRSEAYLTESQRISHTCSAAFNVTEILYFSDEACRMFGFDPLQGMPSRKVVWQRLHPDDQKRMNENIERAVREKTSYPDEFRVLLPDGTIKHVESICLPLFSAAGDFVEIIGTGIDVTERKRAEDALREREAQLFEARRELRQLIDTIRTPVASYSADNRCEFANAAWKQYTGLSDEAALGTDWSVVTHPDHIAAADKMRRDALATGKLCHAEERVRRADGQYRWFAIDRVAARDENGNITKWYATGYDIDDRKRAVERLRVQHTVAQILAEAATIEEASPRILLALGECLGWDVGVLWRVDREASTLRCVEHWHTASVEVPEFERVSRESTFGPGLGLPGRVWSSLKPEYIPDVVPDENFPRAPTAELEGLRAAFGFPILLGGQALGVIEFFSREIKQPDPELLNVLATIGSQIGQFIERKRAERALQEREAKIRRLVDANIIGIFIWDFDGRILEANEAFLHIVGYDHKDLVAGRLRWMDLTPPEWRERDAQLIEEHRGAGTLQPFEKEYFRKDGSRVPVLIGVATFEGSGDQGVAFVIDLTERKRAEEALRRGEAWLAQAHRLSQTGTWVMDGTTKRFLYFSDESYRIWELDPLQGLPSREEMWGRIHPDDRERVWGEVQEAIREQRAFFAEFRILLPDGTVKYVEANTHHVFSPLGALLEVICTNVDVTERKRAQDEREKLRQLESDLTHMSRLSVMGELAASLAHEIAQPIASARNNARAAMHFLSRILPEQGDAKEALACVVDDADRAAEILDRIRDQIKKAPPRKDHFVLSVAINEVMVLARDVIVRNGVSVQSRLADGLFSVQGDRVQLQQVLLNLILNAAEAMGSVEAGPRELLITAEQNPAGVRVAVRDSGPGIDPAHLERVFDAFYTTKPSGVGMGLSICRSIIESHGGRLRAELNAPRGAVFHFNLPSAQTPASE